MARVFLQQRLHPALRIDWTATVMRGEKSTLLHCRQGDWDGACGAHCAAMALALMRRIVDATVLCDRRKGIAGRLWKAAQAHYFDGFTAAELADTIESLGADLHVMHYRGSHRKCLTYMQEQLAAGRLAIISWISRNGIDHHWVLAVGIEGLQEGRTFTPQTVLVLDPDAAEPQLCGYNGRLRFAPKASIPGNAYITYASASGWTLQVRLTSVVAIGEA